MSLVHVYMCVACLHVCRVCTYYNNFVYCSHYSNQSTILVQNCITIDENLVAIFLRILSESMQSVPGQYRF